jgi:acyl carrier protein
MTNGNSSGGRQAVEAGAESSADAFASETERQVAEIFAEILELQWVSPEDDIFTLGGDSFEAVRIALELEYRFNIELPVELLESAVRVRDLAAWIETRGGPVVGAGAAASS